MDMRTEPALHESTLTHFDDLTVERVMNREILECSPETPLHKVAQQMSDSHCSSIIVVEGDEVIGIWTERDALEIDFSKPESFSLQIKMFMSSPVKTIKSTESMHSVAMFFQQYGLRHLVVINESGHHVGIVSQSDVVWNHAVEHYLRLRKVKSILNRPLITVDQERTISDAIAMMYQLQSDSIIVNYHDGELGILTERDVVNYLAEQRYNESVGNLASRPLRSFSEEVSLYHARNLLVESRLRHMGVTNENGEVIGLISFNDIMSGIKYGVVQELEVALKDRDRALNKSRRHLRLAEKVIECSPEGVMITNRDGIIESVNPAFVELTGYSTDEVIGKTPSILSSGRHDENFYSEMWQKIESDGYWQGEIWNRRKSGEIYPELLTITAIHDDDGELTHYASLFSDITDLKEREEKIKHLAYFDPLTGLPNRRLLDDRLTMAIAHAHRSNSTLAVMFLDLDRFKRINDSLGHGVGDELLKVISQRLQGAVREDDTVARMGGDEFILIASENNDAEGAVTTAHRIIDALQIPVVIDGNELVVTCSIGISLFPSDGTDSETLLQNADTAMYRSKDLGRNSYQLYSPAMNASSLEHLVMESGMRRALENEEFELYYQPLNDTHSHELKGAEVLLRWKHPEMGYIAPSDFIPLAEETNLIIPIGEWALRNACRQLKSWHDQGHTEMRLAINISVCQFQADDFLEVAYGIITDEKVDPDYLTFELTESMLMDDALDSIRRLNAIRKMGIHISLDDFGTGYSSLAYLKRFPINTLKIDRMFIHDMSHTNSDEAIVSAVITLAHSMGLKVVAEGVEKKCQLDYLKSEGCDLIQGYYFGQPVSADNFAASHLNVSK